MADNSFASLGVSPFLMERLKEKNITEALDIQKMVIPALLKGESLIFRSATGTGKTFAYLLPILKTLLEGEPKSINIPRCLIAAPTHELCSQIKGEADFLLRGTELKTALLIGQAQIARQVEILRKEKPHLIVGNPGRLLRLAMTGKLKLEGLEYLVIDEGDRLVSDELFEETRGLIAGLRKNLPPKICFISCSATLSPKSRERLLSLLDTGSEIKVIESNENILKNQVEHWAFYSEDRDKLDTLRSFIAACGALKRKGKLSRGRALIFSSRGREVQNIAGRLRRFKLDAAGLWGEMDRKTRKAALDDFRGGRIRFLVSSDLASRGLDIPDLDYVIGLDVGESPEQYIHRSGRTARAGKRGVMVTIGNERELRLLASLEKKLGIRVFPKQLYGGKIVAPAILH